MERGAEGMLDSGAVGAEAGAAGAVDLEAGLEEAGVGLEAELDAGCTAVFIFSSFFFSSAIFSTCLNIQILHFFCIFLDIEPARLHRVAHKNCE